MSSPYFDRRSELCRHVFGDAFSYPEYLATGNGRERAGWARAEAAVPGLPEDAGARLDAAGRIVNVLCLSCIWCGDCVRSVPIVARLAGAAGPSVDLRFVDRDAIPELRDELRVLGAMRVPMVVFLTEGLPRVETGGDHGDGQRSRRGRSATGRRQAQGRGRQRDLEPLRRPLRSPRRSNTGRCELRWFTGTVASRVSIGVYFASTELRN